MKIFVYGTLLKGLQRERALSHSQFLGSGWAQGELYDLGRFPGMKKGNGKVLGELYSISPQTLVYINQIEGYDPDDPENSLYVRKNIIVTLDSTNKTIKAESYFYNRPVVGKKRITHGDYRAYLIEKLIPERY